jgi:RNA polymerase-binding transcription factor DksA
MLTRRQAELNSQVQHRIGGLRASVSPEVHGQGEDSDADVQQDIELALIQVRAEASRQIDAALRRIDAGDYGDCASCGEEIPAKRLQALPFAIRCVKCAGAREDDTARSRLQTRERETSVGAYS